MVTTTDQRTAERGREPLQFARQAPQVRRPALAFGQNLVPLAPGTVRVGDPVTVLA
ncbi:MOSC domain-containing protein [Streptomyces hirsutus]